MHRFVRRRERFSLCRGREEEEILSKNPPEVIVGAGFGGLGVAEHLAQVSVDVTLIDRHNYHTFQPLLCVVWY